MTTRELIVALATGQTLTGPQFARLERRYYKVRREAEQLGELLADCYVPCPGEAHSNPHVDRCVLCAPRWGRLPDPEKVEG